MPIGLLNPLLFKDQLWQALISVRLSRYTTSSRTIALQIKMKQCHISIGAATKVWKYSWKGRAMNTKIKFLTCSLERKKKQNLSHFRYKKLKRPLRTQGPRFSAFAPWDLTSCVQKGRSDTVAPAQCSPRPNPSTTFCLRGKIYRCNFEFALNFDPEWHDRFGEEKGESEVSFSAPGCSKIEVNQERSVLAWASLLS